MRGEKRATECFPPKLEKRATGEKKKRGGGSISGSISYLSKVGDVDAVGGVDGVRASSRGTGTDGALRGGQTQLRALHLPGGARVDV